MTFFDLFPCRILDKLKSSSAEAQIQIGRLSEDLSQAKVNAIFMQILITNSKCCHLQHFKFALQNC